MSNPEDTRFGCWHCGIAGPRAAFEVRGQRYFCIDQKKCVESANEVLSAEEAAAVLEGLERGEF